MTNQKIEPSKVTKPIQLVAAWLVGLVLVNGAFLTAASGIDEPVWLKATLIIAAIVNVPIFLGAIFLLQTKFRPQLQEDSYYSQYLDKSSNEIVTVSKDEQLLSTLSEVKAEIITLNQQPRTEPVTSLENKAVESWPHWKIALCDYLPDFTEIKNELRELNIPIAKIFGSVSTKNIPEYNHFSFNKEVDFKSKLKILRMLSKYRFDGYSYSPTSKVNPEEIYIGGFGYANGGFYPFTEELKELITKDIEPSELKYFEDKVGKTQP